MATKNNIRSIRFSDELAEVIDQQIGKNFTEKLENLITRCMWELPQKEEQLKRVNEMLEDQRKRLSKTRETISLMTNRMHVIQHRLQELETNVEQLEEAITLAKNM